MTSRIAFAVLLTAAAVGLASPAEAQQLVRIPNTSVSIVPPAGFRIARDFAGMQSANRSVIRITEYPPDSYSDLASAFTSPKTASQRFAEQGVRFTRIDQITIGDVQAPLAIGGQEDVNGRETVKYMTVLGGEQRRQMTVWVVFEVTDGSTLRRSDVEAAMQSIVIDRQPTAQEKLAKLPFKFRAVAPFQAAQAGDNGVWLALGGVMDRSGAAPTIIIERSPTSATPAEVAQLDEKLVRDLSGFAQAEISEQASTPFAGGRGHKLKAVAGERTVVQYIEVSGGW